jgi:transcriptional regulator with XRE-family HTH domain
MFAYARGGHESETVKKVFALRRDGYTQAEIAVVVGIGQSTVGRWLRSDELAVLRSPMRQRSDRLCPGLCPRRSDVPGSDYAYLLGQYLGDGTLVPTGRGVYRLFITCCASIPT